ncbi:hypothetical protein UMM65_07380 [Aureibaculum sp. 2210JD6-5]|uniref:hypothetical protein n=1 Tax=Aureibaculum sp. 2210JD6-5 TaxID=3103957 RepID=UPI002AAEC7FA|nr:hypothetical protein [Aureibaculum sp. 2210JD6-5]MDY7395058.1 hypothetical protein [Aureibaculum sp. 2210JD6-5]
MNKLKHLILFCSCCILFFSCETKKTNTETSVEKIKTDTVALDVEKLRNDQAQLSQLDFKVAIAKHGEPQEKDFIKIKKDSIPFNLELLIEKHYPNKEYLTTNIGILEASWKLQDQSWIQVWYKLENDKWIPIDVLVTV